VEICPKEAQRHLAHFFFITNPYVHIFHFVPELMLFYLFALFCCFFFFLCVRHILCRRWRHQREEMEETGEEHDNPISPSMLNKEEGEIDDEEEEMRNISKLLGKPSSSPHQSPPGSFISNLSVDRSGVGGGGRTQSGDSPSDEWGAAQVHKSPGSVSVSRCACHHSSASGFEGSGTARRRRCQMMESFSLTEIRSSPSGNGTSLSPEFEPIHNRSLSVQGTMATHPRQSPYYLEKGTPYGQQQEHSRSDSSFNYESNMSEVDTMNKPVNYFEYRSLESLDSQTISDTTISQQDGDENEGEQEEEDLEEEEEEEEEANSTRVNFDEGSTFTSPREEELVVIEDGLYSLPMVIANLHSPQTVVVVNGLDKTPPPSSPQKMRNTPPPTPTTTPVKTSCPDSRDLTGCATTTPCNVNSSVKPSHSSSTSSKGSRGPSRGKTKSLSTRDRRRRAQSNNKRTSNEDVSVRTCQRTLHDPQADQHSQQTASGEHADWSILPIFKQLIVQRQLETGGGCHSQPIGGISDDERITTTTTTTKTAIEEIDEGHRQMSSCPNLSIKCDVVEYF
jgi:hypothetical protein